MILTKATRLFARTDKKWKLRRGAITAIRITEIYPEDYNAPPHHYIDTPEALVRFEALAAKLGVSQAELLRRAARAILAEYDVAHLSSYSDFLEASTDAPITLVRYDLAAEKERQLKLVLLDEQDS